MATKPIKKRPIKKLNLRPVNHVGNAPGSRGLGANCNGALASPALNPGVREQ